MNRNHFWFTTRAAETWASSPGRSLLCIVPTGCGNSGASAFVQEWIQNNFVPPRTAASARAIILTIVPEQSTSAERLVGRLRRQARQRISYREIADGDGDPSEALEDLVMDIHAAGYYPIIIVDRFHSFARIADDAIVSILSQMRTLEHGRSLTTVAISSMSYNVIRQAIPPELAFVNSSYGDNHDHIVMTPISYQEFFDNICIDEPSARNLFQMGGGPDCVYQTLIDEYSQGVNGLSERCIARVSATVTQFLSEMDPHAGGVLEALNDIRTGGCNLPKLSYLRSIPLFRFVTREVEGSTVSINGSILSSIVERLLRPQDKKGLGMSIKVLVVSANPDFDLDTEREVQTIRDLVDSSVHRDKITVNCILAATPDSFLRGLRAHRPNVVHFSGHGSDSGIIMRGDGDTSHLVQGPSIAGTLKDRQVDLVVLNACFSASYADNIASSARVVVGTFAEVGDEAALRFSRAFYRTIFDGHSVKDALKDGMDAVELYSLENVYEHRGDVTLSITGNISSH